MNDRSRPTDPPVPTPPLDHPPAAGGDWSLGRILGLGLITRVVVDTATQLFFPFLPIIAAGMGLTPIVLGRLVSVRSLMGLLAPLVGGQAERFGYRPVMRLSLLCMTGGLICLGFSNGLWLALPGMGLFGLGAFSFIPVLQAYLSQRLPYERRARGLGTLEYAWAFSGIFGLALMGELIARISWRAPFFLLGALLLVFIVAYRHLPSARSPTKRATSKGRNRPARNPATAPEIGSWTDGLKRYLALGQNAGSSWSAIAATGLIMFAALHVYLSYGTWLAQSYGYGAAALGRTALLLGLADLLGSVLVSTVSDRFGKRRSVLSGALLAAVCFSLLPGLGAGAGATLAGLWLGRFAFEFSFVSNITLVSEQAPERRSQALTLSAAAGLLGSSVAGLSGPWAFARFGPAGLGYVSALTFVVAGLLVLWRVRDVA